MNLKALKTNLFLMVIFFCWPITISQASDSDVIGIRIVPNPENLSVSRWYASQGFIGSPQSLMIDSYPAIRDGRTVYVNVANIENDNLYTNILLISYNQNSSLPTVDIFGQIVNNMKFNSNIEGIGACSLNKNISCFYDSDCPLGEYCNSLKARVIRDVKRLEGIAEIKRLVGNYQSRNNNYPRITSGTYVSGFTMSTWPSWQKTLAIELGGPLPIDPINKMGACPGFATTTCWNETTKRFAGDLTKKTLPQGTSAYIYYADPQGSGWGTCVQTESGYSNLQALNCFADQYSNNPPVFKDVNLSGFPSQEFYGFVWGLDSDGDKMTLQAELFNPNNSSAWQSGGWEWDAGNSGFKVTPSNTPGQFTLHAATVGRYLSGYQVKLTLDDGRNLPNSRQSQTYPVNIGFGESVLSDSSGRVAIGNSLSLKMFGQDVDGSALTSLNFKSAFLGENELNKTQWEQMGFSLKEMSLSGIYKPSQKTGNYIVNVSSKSPLGGKDKLAAFRYSVYNTPPVFKELVASFPDGSGVGCQNDCSINVYNGEKATVKVVGVDSENHKINYELVDNLGGKISINKSSGLITGLEKLDSGDESFKTFTVKLKMFDDYCASSSEQECSSLYSFDIVARQVCSSDNPKSFLKAKANGPFKVTQSGQKLNTGLVIPDCGEILGNKGTVAFNGVEETIDRNQAIVIISDLSYSMQNNVKEIPAVERLKGALIGSNIYDVKSGGLFNNIYEIGKERQKKGLFVKTIPISYNSKVWGLGYGIDLESHYYSDIHKFEDILNPGVLNIFKTSIEGYYRTNVDYPETHTLKALNKAEEFFEKFDKEHSSETIAKTDKIVILISDGFPEISGINNRYRCTYQPPTPDQCPCQDDGNANIDRSNCTTKSGPPEGCWYEKTGLQTYKWWYESCSRYVDQTCYSPCYIKEVGDACAKGQSAKNGYYIYCHCEYVPPTTRNTFPRLKQFLTKMFGVPNSRAITEYTNCATTYEYTFDDEKTDEDCYEKYGDYYRIGSVGSKGFIKCDTSSDVRRQTELMKADGVTIYTVYYDTQGTQAPKQNMCSWSSNNGTKCNNNLYAFSGQNIDEMINKLSSNLKINKPRNVKVNNIEVTDPEPYLINSYGEIEIDGLTCSNLNPIVTYQSKGFLEFSNIEVNYCPNQKRLN